MTAIAGIGLAVFGLRETETRVTPPPAPVAPGKPVLVEPPPSTPATAKATTQLRERDDVPKQVQSDGYVSTSACIECHPDNHQTWSNSYHSKMTQLASPEAVLGDFNNTELTLGSHRFRLWKERDEFWAEIPNFPELGGDTNQPYARLQVVLTTGSHHNQMYWLATGNSRTLCRLPLAHRVEDNRWVPVRALYLTEPRPGFEHQIGRWNNRCTQCHTTNGKPNELGDHLYDTTVADFGISCESCHGPGKAHVDEERRLKAEGGQRDRSAPSIINPARLPHDRASHVCARCHGYSLPISMDLPATDFRPGEELSKTHHIWKLNDASRAHMRMIDPTLDEAELDQILVDLFWSDGEPKTAGREFSGLVQTACFTKGEMSCMTCHRLHQRDTDRTPKEWADDQLRHGFRHSNAVCVKCHSEEKFGTAHTHHAKGSSGSLCYNCHMPHTTYGLLNGIRSHKITSPSVQVNLDTRRPNACNLCHLDQSLQWTAGHLNEWYKHPIPELDKDDQSYAAGALWSLRGDALQRVLTAWSMGWKPAQEASGTDWMAPYLTKLMTDNYDAVRYVSGRSLKRLPEFNNAKWDYIAPPPIRDRMAKAVVQEWLNQPRAHPDKERLIFNEAGQPNQREFERLLEDRDHTVFNLPE